MELHNHPYNCVLFTIRIRAIQYVGGWGKQWLPMEQLVDCNLGDNKELNRLQRKQERLPSSKLGLCASVWGQTSHYLFISLAWHSSASACFHYFIHHVFVSLKSDLQAEIWLSIVDLSPIITLLQSIMF